MALSAVESVGKPRDQTSGAASAPFGQVTVPNSASTVPARNTDKSFNGSNIWPQRRPSKLRSLVVPSSSVAQITYPSRYSIDLSFDMRRSLLRQRFGRFEGCVRLSPPPILA